MKGGAAAAQPQPGSHVEAQGLPGAVPSMPSISPWEALAGASIAHLWSTRCRGTGPWPQRRQHTLVTPCPKPTARLLGQASPPAASPLHAAPQAGRQRACSLLSLCLGCVVLTFETSQHKYVLLANAVNHILLSPPPQKLGV